MHSRRTAAALLVGACLVLLVGLYLWVDNPSVDVSAADLGASAPAGEVTCSIAPWDAGLNDNRDGPGGEHADAYVDEVAAECYSANSTRFNAAVGSGVLALLMLGAAVITRAKGHVDS